jgi:nitrite reductase/ring-hydroxylating ferredoxin subunit
MAERVVVCRAEELGPGERRIVVPFRGKAGIGVFNVDGEFHALRNICPHKQGPLCLGRVSYRIEAELPPSAGPLVDETRSRQTDQLILRCPWHVWEFDLKTGECLVDPKARVKTYPVVIEDGCLVVYADRADLPAEPVWQHSGRFETAAEPA